MNCMVVLKDFKIIGMKNKGVFKDYANLVPKAAQQFLASAHKIPNNSGKEVTVYEQPKTEKQQEGIFYVGLIVNDIFETVPEGLEFLHIQHSYATIKGKVTQMADLYATLDYWIVDQGHQPATPENYIVEVYFPNDDKDDEDVEVYIPIKVISK